MRTDRGGARSPLVELILARLREFIREPEALFWTFVFPVLMSLALAVAFPNRASPVLVAIAAGPQQAEVRRALQGVRDLQLRDVPATPQGEARALREGEVHLVVEPSHPPTYRFDAARQEGRVARLIVDAALKQAEGRVDPWQAHEIAVQVPGSRYVDWLLPGIVAMNIMGTGMWGLGFSIVSARMKNLLKRLVASPMRRSDYLVAQLAARMVFLAPEVLVPFAFGALVLGMPINGSILSIAVVTTVGALSFASIGLLTATRARTFEAISGILNMTMLPMWILSGVFFSASNFPDAVQPLVQALPLTALIDALREVVLEGATLADVRAELAILGVWTAIPFPIALKLFRWR